MDKKVFKILIIVVVAVSLAGLGTYFYLASSGIKVKNATGGVQTQGNNAAPVQIEVGGVKAGGESGQGLLSVCMDKCGDDVCQKTDPNCGEGGNLNCVCPETPQDCPQDCK